VASNGPFVEVTATAGDGGGARIGDTARLAGALDVVVHVKAPSWAPVDRVVLWSNSVALGEQQVPAGSGTDHRATFRVSCPRDCWLVAEVTGSASMFPVVPATEFEPLDVGVLFQALAVGIDLSGLPLASKLRPDATEVVKPFAMTSPIWIDVDGGGFTPPKPPLPKKTWGERGATGRANEAGGAELPDVRERFRAAQGLVPGPPRSAAQGAAR
jgi:hypothetical protein